LNKDNKNLNEDIINTNNELNEINTYKNVDDENHEDEYDDDDTIGLSNFVVYVNLN
jgi:hypothetical protein